MSRPAVEVADIFRAHGDDFVYRQGKRLSYQQLKIMRAIVRCRTAALGGHIDVCLRCGKDWGISYNSSGIGIVPSAKPRHVNAGSQLEKASFCRPPISMWFLLCRKS